MGLHFFSSTVCLSTHSLIFVSFFVSVTVCITMVNEVITLLDLPITRITSYHSIGVSMLHFLFSHILSRVPYEYNHHHQTKKHNQRLDHRNLPTLLTQAKSKGDGRQLKCHTVSQEMIDILSDLVRRPLDHLHPHLLLRLDVVHVKRFVEILLAICQTLLLPPVMNTSYSTLCDASNTSLLLTDKSQGAATVSSPSFRTRTRQGGKNMIHSFFHSSLASSSSTPSIHYASKSESYDILTPGRIMSSSSYPHPLSCKWCRQRGPSSMTTNSVMSAPSITSSCDHDDLCCCCDCNSCCSYPTSSLLLSSSKWI